MDVQALINNISQRMPEQRFKHVLRVTETAVKLAEKHRISTKDAETASLFHDIAKFMDKEKLRTVIVNEHLDITLLSFHHELWHGPVGAIIAQKEFDIENEDVLNAIRFHTTGRAGMSKLEKLIYVSDMIEPGRNFPGVEQLRAKSLDNLDQTMKACIYHSVNFLLSKKVPVYPDSIHCYNEHFRN